MKKIKFISGEASILVVTAIFVLAAFFLGKSFTQVSAKPTVRTPPPVDYCEYECPTRALMVCPTESSAYISDVKTDCPKVFGEGSGKYTKYADKVLYTPEINVTYNKDESDPHKCHRPTDKKLEDDYLMSKDQVRSFKEDNAEFLDSTAVAPEGYFLEEGVCYPNEDETDESPIPLSTPGDQCSTIDGFQGNVPDGWFQLSGSTICREFSPSGPPPSPDVVNGEVLGASTEGQVLGASTMAGAGSFDSVLYQAIMGLGGIITTFGLKKALRKAN